MKGRKRSLGQVFLVNKEIVAAEAAHASDKVVLEIGPGSGILTEELCKNAKKVIAVEKDAKLVEELKINLPYKNLDLINADFLKVNDSKNLKDVDIVISNIPYYLSSSVIEWLYRNRMSAVLCLQKEFVEHMSAEPGSRDYSRLSVMCTLLFRIVKIMNVGRGNFRPIPEVDSVMIYLEPKDVEIGAREEFLISLLMQHKKKTVRNALLDSRKKLELDKERLREVAESLKSKDERLFKMDPNSILNTASEIMNLVK